MKLKTAAEIAQKASRDPSTKVGAAIAAASGEIVGYGYNDFPPGVPEHWWDDRELKYRGVIHAEANAIVSAGRVFCDGGTIHVTSHPCRECAKLIVAAGIVRVVCPPGPWRDDPEIIATRRDAAELLGVCGVEIVDAE